MDDVVEVSIADAGWTDETEDWLKTSWPYADADGDPVTSLVEMRDLFPTVDVLALLDLPVGRHMPARLRAQAEAARDEEAMDGSGPDIKSWIGLE